MVSHFLETKNRRREGRPRKRREEEEEKEKKKRREGKEDQRYGTMNSSMNFPTIA